MKISTITCHNVYNHGALLQAWALATYLQSEGFHTSIIDYQPDYLRGHYDLVLRNSKFDHPIIKQLYLLAKIPSWLRSLKRKKSFDTFFDRYIRPLLESVLYLNYDVLKSNPPEADVYIAGSDQIWNTRFNNGKDPAFYLDFGGDETRRISYAASFATEKLIGGVEEFVKEKLEKFDAISVRENSGLQILNSLHLCGTQVLDPVFLLDAEAWLSHIGNTLDKLPDHPYILVYDTLKTDDLSRLVSRLKILTKMKAYTINSEHTDVADSRYKNIGPDGFLHLIANASMVISNSFHATAFSIIFKRDFFVVDRPDGLNRRMKDLLDMLQLGDRYVNSNVSDAVLTSSIKYNETQEFLNSRIEDSKRWLKQSL